MDNADLGTQIFLYTPDDGVFEELTELVGAGFGNYQNKYTWSATLFDGNDEDLVPELYVGTLNSQSDFLGLITAGLRLDALFSTGTLPLTDFVGFSSDSFSEFLATDFPNVINSTGPELWKYDFTTKTWTKTLDVASAGGELDDNDIGFRDAVSANGKLFVGTSTSLVFNALSGGENEAKLFVSEDGENFERLTGGPLDPAEGNTSIRALVEVQLSDDPTDTGLLVGTGNINSGAQLWIYGNDGSWTEVARFDGTDLPFTATVSEIFQFDVGDDLKTYVGTWFEYGVFELNLETLSLENVSPPNPPTDSDNGVMQFAEYDGYLYVGSVDYDGGASLYRSQDPSLGWEPAITTDGFENLLPDYYGDEAGKVEAPVYLWSMDAIGDSLYIGDFNPDQGTLLRLTHDEDDNVTVSVVPSEDSPQEFGSGGIGLRKFVPIELDAQGLPTVEQGAPNALIMGSADDAQTLGDNSPLDRVQSPSGEFVTGTSWSGEILTGGEGEDIILGGAGDDVIEARGEDDIVVADAFGLGFKGDDTVKGGAGDDLVFGNTGDDFIQGQRDEDVLVGGSGRDTIKGGSNIDLIIGDFLTDLPLSGFVAPNLGQDDQPVPDEPSMDDPLGDFIAGLSEVLGAPIETAITLLNAFSRFDDALYGGKGNDIVFAGLGSDRAFGGAGEDVLNGMDGRDRLFGGADDDILDGGAGNDIVRGQSGDDVIVTGLGNDTLFGNRGNDRFLVLGEEGAETVDTGNDVIVGFREGEDAIDLSAFFQRENPFIPGPPVDFAVAVEPAFSESDDGWLIIDLSGLSGNVDGTGTIVVQGLRFEDTDITDFKLGTVLTPEADFGGFF